MIKNELSVSSSVLRTASPLELLLPRAAGGEELADLRGLVGEPGWSRLHPAIRQRFGTCSNRGEKHLYCGRMEKVQPNWFGVVTAWISRLFGSPMAWSQGENVPCDVYTYDDESRPGGTVWERHYFFRGQNRQVARTTKIITNDMGLLECFGGGLGMTLKLEEKRGALSFISTAFFIEINKARFTLPRLLSPGRLEVTHRHVGPNCFQFTLEVFHPLLGRTVFQDGYFSEKEMTDGACTWPACDTGVDGRI
ncbi:DUF4166 domain-containing protein [Kiloniella laminariae]|uniref:DUF4166 domain-containing protein n=1 Tax=Kiloniella laminariae TaxID=454162 RepID=UPI0003685C95|nr:DUF4166 domain-containing protein [Kiloniella laminariae]